MRLPETQASVVFLKRVVENYPDKFFLAILGVRRDLISAVDDPKSKVSVDETMLANLKRFYHECGGAIKLSTKLVSTAVVLLPIMVFFGSVMQSPIFLAIFLLLLYFSAVALGYIKVKLRKMNYSTVKIEMERRIEEMEIKYL